MSRFPTLALLPLAALAGCSCNQEYSFPKLDLLDNPPPPVNYGRWLSMDTAPDDLRIAMSYYDHTAGALGFAVGVPEGDQINWVHEHVDGYAGSDGLDRGDLGKYSSLKVFPDGTVWIAYQDVGNGGLYAAHRLGPNLWETGLVDPGKGKGMWASLGVGLDGQPMIAHHDDEAGTLRVCRPNSESWTCETAWEGEDALATTDTGVTTITADVGEYAKVLVAGGVEYIAFYDRALGNLDLLEGTGGGWTHTVIDERGDVGQWPDLLLDGEDLYVSYHDVGDQDLMLAARTGGSWDTMVVDNGDYVGADSEVFTTDGTLQILYFDGFNNDMKLASYDGGGLWSTQTLDGTGNAAGFHNEAVTVGGRTWTASYDYTNNALITHPL